MNATFTQNQSLSPSHMVSSRWNVKDGKYPIVSGCTFSNKNSIWSGQFFLPQAVYLLCYRLYSYPYRNILY